jgi:hypothetical protein
MTKTTDLRFPLPIGLRGSLYTLMKGRFETVSSKMPEIELLEMTQTDIFLRCHTHRLSFIRNLLAVKIIVCIKKYLGQLSNEMFNEEEVHQLQTLLRSISTEQGAYLETIEDAWVLRPYVEFKDHCARPSLSPVPILHISNDIGRLFTVEIPHHIFAKGYMTITWFRGRCSVTFHEIL